MQHLRFATNGGRIRSTITVFQETAHDERGIRIWNHQLIRYAGYQARDGTILGDPQELEFTKKVTQMGWRPPSVKGAFDILPLVIEVPGTPPKLFELPREVVMEVTITHPDFSWFADLHLRWHAVPAISDMALVGERRKFSAAPFNGYYMGTEIASRNFGDIARYNLLPVVAEKMGIDTRSRTALWKDRALVELNTAVLHSFAEAGITMVDHHTASAQFIRHIENEKSQGREVPGDWSWLVPPLSSSSCPVFHRSYSTSTPLPHFIKQQRAWI